MPFPSRCGAAFVLAVAGAIPIPAQVYTWTLASPPNAPSARRNTGCAYDSVRQRTVLFGGWTGSILGDTWEWDGTDWSARFSAHYPSPRWDLAMAYDSARQRVVLFGGLTNTGAAGDTWEWDGVDWVQRTTAIAPSPRWAHELAYDSVRQRVVLFGGLTGGSGIPNGQTWEWDGTSWLQRTPGTVPPARSEHALAYDPVRQVTVMFGGWAQSNTINETWEWNGTDWTLRTLAGPNGRRNVGMVFDAQRQRILAFGGNYGSGETADTHEWDGNAWTQLSPVASPSARMGHAMAYDLARQRTVLFSGSVPANDTWTRGVVGTPATATPFGSGCGAPPLGFVPAARPIVGQSGGATITNATSPAAGVALGFSNTSYGPFSLPVTLGGIGMTGCMLLQSSEILGLATAPLTATTLSFGLGIPNLPALIGSRVYLQAYAFAPGANPLQVLASNGIEWFFGDV